MAPPLGSVRPPNEDQNEVSLLDEVGDVLGDEGSTLRSGSLRHDVVGCCREPHLAHGSGVMPESSQTLRRGGRQHLFDQE